MKKTFWQKKIPTLLGLFIITIAIAVTTALVGQNTFFVQHASPTTTPQGLRITNISDSSFTVSYSTSGSFLGSLNFGKNRELGQTVGDDSDNGTVKDHYLHSFTLKNLSPSTQYFFSVVSGQDTYLNNGIPYEVTTGPEIQEKGTGGFVTGKVITPNGNPPKEAIAYLNSDGSQTLSALVKNDGTFTVSLENLRASNLSSFFNFKTGSVIKMLIIADSGSSSITLSPQEVINVPIVIIGKSYDFTQEGIKTATGSARLSGFPQATSSSTITGPEITTPSTDQTFATQKPVFKGTGTPNDTVKIEIRSSQTIDAQVTTDSSGNWTFQPTTSLAPGNHTITITAKDSSGILRTITQSFIVLAASVSPTPTATASASPSASPSSTPTPTPIVISASPSASVSPTPIVIATPPPTPRPTLPPTGTSEVSTGIMGLTLSVIGGFFLVLSKFLL